MPEQRPSRTRAGELSFDAAAAAVDNPAPPASQREVNLVRRRRRYRSCNESLNGPPSSRLRLAARKSLWLSQKAAAAGARSSGERRITIVVGVRCLAGRARARNLVALFVLAAHLIMIHQQSGGGGGGSRQKLFSPAAAPAQPSSSQLAAR